jgi:hypothetical protein
MVLRLAQEIEFSRDWCSNYSLLLISDMAHCTVARVVGMRPQHVDRCDRLFSCEFQSNAVLGAQGMPSRPLNKGAEKKAFAKFAGLSFHSKNTMAEEQSGGWSSSSEDAEHVPFAQWRNTLFEYEEAEREREVTGTEGAEDGKWAPLFAEISPSSSSLSAGRSLRVLSLNVFFSDFEWERRCDAVSDFIVSTGSLDVACFQEVTPRFWQRLLRRKEIRERFWGSDDPDSAATVRPYGVTMLVSRALPPPRLAWIDLPTGMARRGLCVCFPCVGDGVTAAVATVHLESLANTRMRQKQLRVMIFFPHTRHLLFLSQF